MWTTRQNAGLVLAAPLLASGLACAGAEPPAPEAPVAVQVECEPLPARAESLAEFEAGQKELEASREGEHYATDRFEPAMARLLAAARGGYRPAQARYGTLRFSLMFQNTAPEEAQREAYVEALTFARLAARGGETPSLPGINAEEPAVSELPLSELPRAWLEEAWQRADAWLACHGLPWT